KKEEWDLNLRGQPLFYFLKKRKCRKKKYICRKMSNLVKACKLILIKKKFER
ncbi:polysaccharide pyruvyl transferase CsaB, partial [Bacillus anthracis]|nr:polysaccharide pyruvyl transferase CsaB [Bacillus anthracis]